MHCALILLLLIEENLYRKIGKARKFLQIVPLLPFMALLRLNGSLSNVEGVLIFNHLIITYKVS